MASATENRRINIYINGKEIRNDMKSIRGEYAKARNQLDKMTRGTDEYNRKMKDVQKLRGVMDQHNQKLRSVTSTWSQLKGVMLGVIGGNIATNIFQRIVSFIPQMIEGNAKLSDSFADVQKNADLSNEEMEELYRNLRNLDSRTKNSELLEIAAAAGKSGIKGVANLTEAVRQLDQVQVALGDDLGDGAVSQLQKVAATFDTEILNIGSGINALSDSTKANAGFLTEWITRMAGSSKQVNISAGDVLGYGTTLDELGLKVEMSSTALNGFFMDFVKNTEKFGSVAGFARGELSQLIGEKGTNEGFVSFLEKLKEGSNSSQDFLKKLEAVGVSGDRGSQVFLALSQNLEQLRTRQQLANDEIEKGTSLTNEFNKRNNNLAGQLEKIGKKLRSVWANSTLKNGIESFVSRLADYVATKPSEEMERERVEMNLLVMKINRLNVGSSERVKLINELKKQYPDLLAHINAETVSNEDLNKSIKDINQSMVNKIILAEKDEAIKEKRKKVAYWQKDLLEHEKELEKKILKVAEARDIEYDKTKKTIEQAIEVRDKLTKQDFKEGNYSGVGSVGFGLGGLIEDYNVAKAFLDNEDKKMQKRIDDKEDMAKRLRKSLVESNFYESEVWNSELNSYFQSLKDENNEDNNPLVVDVPVQITPVIAKDKKEEQLKSFAEALKKANEDFASNARGIATFDSIGEDDKDEIDDATASDDNSIDGQIAYYEKLLTIARDYGYKASEIEDEIEKLRAQKKFEKLNEIADKVEEYYNHLASIAHEYMRYLEMEDNARLDSINRRRDAELRAIDDTAEHTRRSARQVEAEKLAVEERYARESARIKEKQWKRQQIADVIQSAINVVLAVTRQGITTPQAIATGIAGAAKTAFIASQKPPQFYARGVTGSPRTRAVVGEQGPEIIDLPEGSNVYTAPQTEDLLSPAVQPRLNFSGVDPSNGMGVEAQLQALRKDMQNWKTRIRGDWRKDEFDQVVDREKFADSLVNIG